MKRFFRNTNETLKSGKGLGMVGWWLFLAALLLPAIWVSVWSDGAWYWGWQCFQVVLMILWSGIKEVVPATLYLGYALANLLTLFAPLFLRAKSQRPWLLRGLAVFYLLNTASALYLASEGFDKLGPGYYAWTLSFCLIGIGCAKLSMQPRTQTVPLVVTPPQPKTPEERAAEQELREYLG